MIRAEGIEKRYGRKRALRGITFALDRGGCLAVTGPNGSGKTTLLRLLAGLAVPTRGTLDVATERSQLGFLGHEPLLYRELTALENLDLFGRLYRVRERRERAGMLLERFGLWDERSERVATYSRGMTQRLALCRVLLHEPQLLVLDEPFTALDDDARTLVGKELATLAGDRTLVVSTHDAAAVEPFATARLALLAGTTA